MTTSSIEQDGNTKLGLSDNLVHKLITEEAIDNHAATLALWPS